eukprot:7280377-Ditylum_brightwellii.AAC.1
MVEEAKLAYWEEAKKWDPGKVVPNEYLLAKIANLSVHFENENDEDDSGRTEIDSHANMVVLGKHTLILEDTGRAVDVQPVMPDYKTLKNVKIVDDTVLWEHPYNQTLYILVFKNALHVLIIDVNLVPPFIMREAGLTVNEVPKIQTPDPLIEDHSIWFPGENLRFNLLLHGIFLYFLSSKPSSEQIEECVSEERVLLMTPEG